MLSDNVKVISPEAAPPMLDSKLAALINTCVKDSQVTFAFFQVDYIYLTVELQVNYIRPASLKS